MCRKLLPRRRTALTEIDLCMLYRMLHIHRCMGRHAWGMARVDGLIYFLQGLMIVYKVFIYALAARSFQEMPTPSTEQSFPEVEAHAHITRRDQFAAKERMGRGGRGRGGRGRGRAPKATASKSKPSKKPVEDNVDEDEDMEGNDEPAQVEGEASASSCGPIEAGSSLRRSKRHLDEPGAAKKIAKVGDGDEEAEAASQAGEMDEAVTGKSLKAGKGRKPKAMAKPKAKAKAKSKEGLAERKDCSGEAESKGQGESQGQSCCKARETPWP